MTTLTDVDLPTEEDPWAGIDAAPIGGGFDFEPGSDKQNVEQLEAEAREAERQIRHRQRVRSHAYQELIRLEGRDLALQEHARRKAEERRALAGATEPLDWSTFLTQDMRDIDWLTGKIMAAGQQISLVGGGKVGKSLFSLEWAWRMAAGMSFIGDVARSAVRVLYVDQENGHDDIQSRLVALGARPDGLANLAYLSFPRFAPLDTPEGGADLLAAVEAHQAQFVFLDTISRMVEGEENANDTWLNLYRYTTLPLKSRRISSCRLDHFGKDDSRGARGGSAKDQDVDHVWELVAADKLLKLKRTHTRNGLGRDVVMMRRQGRLLGGDRWAPGETRHVLATGEPGEPTSAWLVVQSVAQKLDDAGVPRDWGRDRVSARGKDLGISIGKAVWEEVVKYRKGLENLPRAGCEEDASDAALDYRGNW